MSGLPSADVLRHIVDVHCHPTDAPSISSKSMEDLAISICAMSSMQSDQGRVRDLAAAYPDKVTPCFGYHPWFSHLIALNPEVSKEEHYRSLFSPQSTNNKLTFTNLLSKLPSPRPLSVVLAEIRENLNLFPNAMLGEVGLDRAFRVPVDYFASPRELTPFVIPLEHQIAILSAQVELAVELGRNISIHSVKSQQATISLLSQMKAKHEGGWNRISVDMHSCGLSVESWRGLEKKHENVFLSLSTVINHKHSNHRALIAACSPHRLLAESDYNDVNMCAPQTWDMINIIADVKGWQVEREWVDNLEEDEWGVVRRLEQNWVRFKAAHHVSLKKQGKRNKRRDYDSKSSDEEQN